MVLQCGLVSARTGGFSSLWCQLAGTNTWEPIGTAQTSPCVCGCDLHHQLWGFPFPPCGSSTWAAWASLHGGGLKVARVLTWHLTFPKAQKLLDFLKAEARNWPSVASGLCCFLQVARQARFRRRGLHISMNTRKHVS
jgi:hypothetical protein